MVFIPSHLYTTAVPDAMPPSPKEPTESAEVASAAACSANPAPPLPPFNSDRTHPSHFAHHGHSYLAELLKYADQKAVCLITGAGFIFAWLLIDPERLVVEVGPFRGLLSFGMLSLFFSFVAGLFGFLVIYPRQKHVGRGLVAFAAIAKFENEKKYVEAVASRPDDPGSLSGNDKTSTSLTEEVLEHSYRLAKIANKKYICLAGAFWCIVVAILLAAGVSWEVWRGTLPGKIFQVSVTPRGLPSKPQIGATCSVWFERNERLVKIYYDVTIPPQPSLANRVYKVHLNFQLFETSDSNALTSISTNTYSWTTTEEYSEHGMIPGVAILPDTAKRTSLIRATLVFENN
jgi:hypothetical protein